MVQVPSGVPSRRSPNAAPECNVIVRSTTPRRSASRWAAPPWTSTDHEAAGLSRISLGRIRRNSREPSGYSTWTSCPEAQTTGHGSAAPAGGVGGGGVGAQSETLGAVVEAEPGVGVGAVRDHDVLVADALGGHGAGHRGD